MFRAGVGKTDEPRAMQVGENAANATGSSYLYQITRTRRGGMAGTEDGDDDDDDGCIVVVVLHAQCKIV